MHLSNEITIPLRISFSFLLSFLSHLLPSLRNNFHHPSCTMLIVTYIAAAILLTGWATYSIYEALRVSKNNENNGRMPGPRLVPFIGRIHDLPIQYMWLKFKEWSDIYGPIYYTGTFMRSSNHTHPARRLPGAHKDNTYTNLSASRDARG